MSNIPPAVPRPSTCCSLPRLLLLITLDGYLALLTDIRQEHVDVVRDDWKPWIPIIYAIFMALLCLVALFAWKPWPRRIVFWASLLAFIVGGLGVWFHNHGKLVEMATNAARAWYDPNMKHDGENPPPLAPMSFAGLGLLGLLATAKRSQPPA